MGRGPLSALNGLLKSPLEFDATSFINRTFPDDYIKANPGLVELSLIFESTKTNLLAKTNSIAQLLSVTGKLSGKNRSEKKLPIEFELSKECVLPPGDTHIDERICDSINMQLDRLIESFNITRCFCGDFKYKGLSEIISFYLLSEAIFFVFVGIAKVDVENNIFKLSPKDEISKRALHRKWFANYWENCSSAASISYIDFLPKDASESPHFVNAISVFGDNLRDKIFSIPASELPLNISKLSTVKWITKICKLVSLCFWCQLKGNVDAAPIYLVKKIGLSDEDLKYIESIIRCYPVPDRVVSIGVGGVRIENPTITYQLRGLIHDVAKKLSENNLNQLLGNYFEKQYLANYFKNDLKDHYKVHEGIMAHEVIPSNDSLDVDFIIEDFRRNKFIFTQAKYLRVGGKAYLRGDLEHILSGKILKGLRQIEAAKVAMEEGHLKEYLTRRGLVKCNPSNSIFLLVHNVSNFDFCLWSSGVVSYEWNTLRNLFKDGECIYGHTKGVQNIWRNSLPVPIESPDEVIDILMQNSPVVQLGGATSLFQGDHLTAKFTVGEKDVFCTGLGL